MVVGSEAARHEETVEEAPARPRRKRLHSLLVVSTFPLDSRTCLDAGCNRRALVGEMLCPVHLGLASAEEMPDHVSDARARPKRLLRSAFWGLLFAAIGLAIGTVVGEFRFGWLGGITAGAILTASVGRELRLHRLSSVLGLLAFFSSVVLLASAVLVAAIAALPWLLGNPF